MLDNYFELDPFKITEIEDVMDELLKGVARN
jgi:hypothetical protein